MDKVKPVAPVRKQLGRMATEIAHESPEALGARYTREWLLLRVQTWAEKLNNQDLASLAVVLTVMGSQG